MGLRCGGSQSPWRTPSQPPTLGADAAFPPLRSLGPPLGTFPSSPVAPGHLCASQMQGLVLGIDESPAGADVIQVLGLPTAVSGRCGRLTCVHGPHVCSRPGLRLLQQRHPVLSPHRSPKYCSPPQSRMRPNLWPLSLGLALRAPRWFEEL